MFRFLILKYLEFEEKQAELREQNKESEREMYDRSPDPLNGAVIRIEDWYDNTVMGKAESLKREYRRQYREKIKELLGG